MRTHCVLVALLVSQVSLAVCAQETPPAFGPVAPYVLSAEAPRRIAAGDFDEDGFVDLASVPAVGSEVSVLLNDGQAGFASNNDFFAPQPSMWGLHVADVDADGHLDLVICHGLTGNHGVTLWKGLGNSAFTLSGTLLAGDFPIDVVSGDFDEDGILDLAVAANVGFGLALFMGQGGGTFGPAVFVPGQAAMHATSLDAGDIDSDGHLDLLVSHYGGVRAFFGDGTGTFSFTTLSAGNSVLTEHACLVDLDQDGDLDVASVELYGSQLDIRLFEGAGFGPLVSFPTGGFPRDVLPADLNLDGIPDLVVLEESSNTLRIFRGLGGGDLAPTLTLAIGTAPRGGCVADLNNDGRPDLAVALTMNQIADPQAAIVLNATVPGPWTYIPPALAGSQGAPLLHGSGDLTPGTLFALELTHAASGAPTWLVVGTSRADLPVPGGLLVPALDLLLPTAPASATGIVQVQGTWSSGVATGTTFWLQWIIQDSLAPYGFALSNGLRAINP